MRNLITVVVGLALMLAPGMPFAGDQIHHGHGMRSGWDSQTGSGYQGSEYIGEISDFYRVYPDQYHRRGYYPGYQPYAYTDLSVTYNDGNWGASFTYNNPRGNYYQPTSCYPPVCGNYACSGNCSTCLRRYQPRFNPAPVVYPQQPAYYYSTPNYQQYPTPIYSAPANPELGYYASPSQNYQKQPQVVNIYNYYGSEFDQQPDASARQAPGNEAQRTADPGPYEYSSPVSPAVTFSDTPVGTRFYSSAQLGNGVDSMLFTLNDGRLFAGPDNGPPQVVAEGVNESTGALAAYQPGLGYSLIYRIGDSMVAAWHNGGGWSEDPLPEFIDFGAEVTVGMVGGSPWVVFNGFDNRRHIYTYGNGWQELGSATQPGAADPGSG